MQYSGKLYGRIGRKGYFDTSKTGDDWDELESISQQAKKVVSERGSVRLITELNTLEELIENSKEDGKSS